MYVLSLLIPQFIVSFFFFFNDTATTEIYTLSLHDALPILKRENEFAVGLAVIAAFAVVVGGALWLSGAHFGRTEALYTARFRTVGGLGVGNPVVLRGVRVGRVEGIRLASGNWVRSEEHTSE